MATRGAGKLFCTIGLVVLAGAWATGGVRVVHADEPPVAAIERRLTLHEALALMNVRNAEVRVARVGIDAAAADQLAARARPNPTLSLSSVGIAPRFGTGPGVDGRRSTDVTVALSQLFERGDKRALRGDVARFAFEAARSDAAEIRRQQGLLVASSYYELLLAQERVRVVAETAALMQRSVSATEVRLKAGDVAQSDLARIRVDRLRVENDLRQATAEVSRARQRLAFLVGLEREAEALVAADAWPDTDAGRTGSGAYAGAGIDAIVDARLDVTAARQRLDAAAKVRDLARALTTRDVLVSGLYERYPGQPTNRTVGVGVSVPLFLNYQYDGEIRRAETQVTLARDVLDRTRAASFTEIARARSDLAAARDRVQRFDAALLAEAARSAEAAEFAYRHGALGVIDLLDARRILYSTRIDAAAARADLARALVAWEAAVQPFREDPR
jgi:cobalt-zinc-cadmium efflux system outer membrane protein